MQNHLLSFLGFEGIATLHWTLAHFPAVCSSYGQDLLRASTAYVIGSGPLFTSQRITGIVYPHGLNTRYEQPILRDPAPFLKRSIFDRSHVSTSC